MHSVFISGGTGFIGSRLIPQLLNHGHQVRALVRIGSKHKIPAGCEQVVGDALDGSTFSSKVSGCDTFIQLVGVSHPSPAKAKEFLEIDMVSAKASMEAAAKHSVAHFIYISVAQPAPMMKAYVGVRAACEEMIKDHRLNATILRPWYVLGPGHYWPYVLVPFYWLAEAIPATRADAQRLGLVTIDDIVATLVDAVEHPVSGTVVAEVPQIRKRMVRPPVMAAKIRDY
jgi:nucleoside-diphosphate-sugar epimerase